MIEYDALEILETMIPDNSLAGFHIFFPDPWPKKKHHKRRLLQRPRTDLLVSKLSPGGYIYFATDWEEYALSALEELSCTEGIHNKYEKFALIRNGGQGQNLSRKGLMPGVKFSSLFL